MTSTSSSPDRSVPRSLRKAGDHSRDGRGRVIATPAILQYGFRPFFLLAGLHAGLAVPSWSWAYLGGMEIAGPFGGMNWHAHEMLFGYVGAVIAGFILTAIPNWTGRLPLSGGPLAVLVALWLVGRIACLLAPDPWLALVADLAFPCVLTFAIWREVMAGRNWKNAPVAVMITLFGAANLLDHIGNMGLIDAQLGRRLASAVIAMLLALIGGRIVPSFTRNWLAKLDAGSLPSSFGVPDKAALAATATALAAWIVVPESTEAGVALCIAGSLLAVRLSRWRGAAALREPILLVLHIGYGWLACALFLLGLAIFVPTLPASAALHALTAGAVGTMTLAVMTRASLGHTGRAIVADGYVVAMYALVTLGALLRVVAPLAGDHHAVALGAGGVLWSSAFMLFVIRYAPILCRPRLGA